MMESTGQPFGDNLPSRFIHKCTKCGTEIALQGGVEFPRTTFVPLEKRQRRTGG